MTTYTAEMQCSVCTPNAMCSTSTPQCSVCTPNTDPSRTHDAVITCALLFTQHWPSLTEHPTISERPADSTAHSAQNVHKMCTRCNISNSNAPQNSVQRPASHGSAALRTANSLACCRRESLSEWLTPVAYVRDRTQRCWQFLLFVFTRR